MAPILVNGVNRFRVSGVNEWSIRPWLPSKCANGQNEPSCCEENRKWRGNRWSICPWTDKSEWLPLRLATWSEKCHTETICGADEGPLSEDVDSVQRRCRSFLRQGGVLWTCSNCWRDTRSTSKIAGCCVPWYPWGVASLHMPLPQDVRRPMLCPRVLYGTQHGG